MANNKNVSEKPENKPKAKSNSNFSSYIIIIICIILVVGLFVFFNNKTKKKEPAKKAITEQVEIKEPVKIPENEAWTKTLKDNNAASFDNFIKNYPGSRNIPVAKEYVGILKNGRITSPKSGKELNSGKYMATYRGYINKNLGYILQINNNNGIISGSYFYTYYNRYNRGEIHGVYYGKTLIINEYNKSGIKTGTLNCAISANKLNGTFYYSKSRHGNKKMPISLNKIKGSL